MSPVSPNQRYVFGRIKLLLSDRNRRTATTRFSSLMIEYQLLASGTHLANSIPSLPYFRREIVCDAFLSMTSFVYVLFIVVSLHHLWCKTSVYGYMQHPEELLIDLHFYSAYRQQFLRYFDKIGYTDLCLAQWGTLVKMIRIASPFRSLLLKRFISKISYAEN